MVEISLSGSGEGPGASKRPGLLDWRRTKVAEKTRNVVSMVKDLV
jgi:uncharacterized lipoprotein YddW (UPF0748 family)